MGCLCCATDSTPVPSRDAPCAAPDGTGSALGSEGAPLVRRSTRPAPSRPVVTFGHVESGSDGLLSVAGRVAYLMMAPADRRRRGARPAPDRVSPWSSICGDLLPETCRANERTVLSIRVTTQILGALAT